MPGGGAGRPRRVCLRNAKSHVVLLFLVQSLGARCVTHCAAGTATSPGRRWQQQQQQQQKQQPRRRRRRRRGPRVSGSTPAFWSAAPRQPWCGRAHLRLGPAARGPRLSAQPASPQAPPESLGGGGRGQPGQGTTTARSGHPREPRSAEGAAPPSHRAGRASSDLPHLLGPRDARLGGRPGDGWQGAAPARAPPRRAGWRGLNRPRWRARR
jgi:hypothetical protein